MQTVLLVVFPYVAVVLALGVGAYRYFWNRYSFSSVSSQLLENEHLYWGSVPWHWGITLILLAHLLPWLFPRAALLALGHGVRLAAAELLGLALGAFALFGIVVLILRRLPIESRARAATSPMDWMLLIALVVQTFTGLVLALFQRWGSLWYLSAAVPWLWSLVRLQPDVTTIAALPALIQFHFVWGFVIVLLFPFTRLVHVVMLPIQYLWRPYQVVVWYAERRPRTSAGERRA